MLHSLLNSVKKVLAQFSQEKIGHLASKIDRTNDFPHASFIHVHNHYYAHINFVYMIDSGD